ncbi:hypothetical protein Dd1591_1935 [Dickeya chrysanthemi Ech1591]|uniref:Uncharacterized protein n=1 Tax=Dickeya chrysanthemi (strain Ech1591) TaxID=561229 RepID=C6CGX2_DICC1|nr:hypothetical protein Dd1591_1935 [Dickeya chrysanthemi Ech1591]
MPHIASGQFLLVFHLTQPPYTAHDTGLQARNAPDSP